VHSFGNLLDFTRPMIPPPALISSTAIKAARYWSSPWVAYGPVRG
jgi:hypothetical protein